ncbi:uncharacterized protein LOC129916122 [Episyrphus balteatus]|uniref:uncharacterized protein LOC129916122 n=1 Tax=Episyrphus balteatus TaxID=286459 RepID=UPI002485C11E|nr:uncharacterized protein LOC129916122 [Episyrphus balteatus]
MPVIGNSYIFVVVICMIVLSIDKTNGKYIQNRPCTTQEGIRGICVEVTTCSNILNLLTLSPKPLPISVIVLVRKAHCGTFNNTHHVCCDPKLIINQKTTQVPPIIMRSSGFEKSETEVEANKNDPDNITDDRVDVVTDKRSEILKTEVEVRSDDHDNITTEHVDVVPEKPSGFEKLQSEVKVKKDNLDTTTDHDYVVVPEKNSSGKDPKLSASAWITILVYFIYIFC